MTGTITRGKVLRGDLAHWDGRVTESTRKDASGGTITGLVVDNSVDIVQVFGSGTAFTSSSLARAVEHIGAERATIVFAPGDWTISASVSIPSNISVHVPAGVDLQIASGITLTVNGPLYADQSGFYSGSGTFSLLADGIVNGQAWGKRTPAEIAAGVTPTNYAYPPGNVLRYGAVGDGVADDSSAIQSAINVGTAVLFPDGVYLAANLTQDTNEQRFIAQGKVQIVKNANGPVITTTGDDVEFNGIAFRGDAASPTFTGGGVVSSGDNLRLINCGARWISGTPVAATGNHLQIIGTCDIYQTTTAAGYDIDVGVSGTATLYHHITNIYTSQAGGGIRFTDCGGHVVMGGQFGKLTVAAGTSPSGVNGGHFTANRINGDVTIGLSSSAFAANVLAAVTATFSAGTSGHSFDESNALAVGATLVDDSTSSVVVDSRLVPWQTYTPTWTAASVNPAIGDGALVGYYTKRGREVRVSVRATMGGTTTYGTGVWYFALPAIPSSGVSQAGVARVFDSGTNTRIGVVETLTDGTARCQVTIDSDADAASASAPITWASGDELRFTLMYST